MAAVEQLSRYVACNAISSPNLLEFDDRVPQCLATCIGYERKTYFPINFHTIPSSTIVYICVRGFHFNTPFNSLLKLQPIPWSEIFCYPGSISSVTNSVSLLERHHHHQRGPEGQLSATMKPADRRILTKRCREEKNKGLRSAQSVSSPSR